MAIKQWIMHPFAAIDYMSRIIPASIRLVYQTRGLFLYHTKNLNQARRAKASLEQMAEIVNKDFRKIDPKRTDEIVLEIRKNAAKFLDAYANCF